MTKLIKNHISNSQNFAYDLNHKAYVKKKNIYNIYSVSVYSPINTYTFLVSSPPEVWLSTSGVWPGNAYFEKFPQTAGATKLETTRFDSIKNLRTP